MDKMKQEIQLKLIANVIIDKCSQSEYLIFRDAWCTQERVIRFTTPFFRSFFPMQDNKDGKWESGDCVMYEAQNKADSFIVNCVLDISSIPYGYSKKLNQLLEKCNANKNPGSSEIILRSWDLTPKDNNTNTLFDNFDQLIMKDIPLFESELKEQLNGSKDQQGMIKEGAQETVTLNKYERNPKARAACLAYHGTSCAVCGIDFAKEYGPEFAGKIEVHHIVPISEIGEEYVVNPIKDLVPVCPNCHTALHSKKDGVYTVEELKEIRARYRKVKS